MIVTYKVSCSAGDKNVYYVWVPERYRPKTKSNDEVIIEMVEDDVSRHHNVSHQGYHGFTYKRSAQVGVNPQVHTLLKELNDIKYAIEERINKITQENT